MRARTNLPVEARLRSRGASIGEVAKATGIRPSAIRYYEACGLLPVPARRSGRRVYDEGALNRLSALAAARRLGFSIRDLRALANLDAEDLRRAARERASLVRRRIVELGAVAARLDQLAECACAAGDACALNAPARS